MNDYLVLYPTEFSSERLFRQMVDVMRFCGRILEGGNDGFLLELSSATFRFDPVEAIEKNVAYYCEVANKTYSIQNYLTLENEYLKIYLYDKPKDTSRMPLSHPEPRFGLYT